MHKDYLIREPFEEEIAGIAHVHWRTWQTSYLGIIKQSYLESRTFEYSLKVRTNVFHNKATLSLVALLHNQVVGFIDGAPLRLHENQSLSQEQKDKRREKGEICALYLLREHQGKGLGGALFQTMKQRMGEKDLTPFIAWVLKDNRKARSFYENQGGVLVDAIFVTIGGDQYQEVAYQFNG